MAYLKHDYRLSSERTNVSSTNELKKALSSAQAGADDWPQRETGSSRQVPVSVLNGISRGIWFALASLPVLSLITAYLFALSGQH